MAELRTIHYKTGAEPWKLAIAERLRASVEEKGIRTKPASEWVRVAELAGIDIVINLTTSTFNVSPETKPLLENLAQEYLIVGVKEIAMFDCLLIRVQDDAGNWHSISPRQATDRQFYDWANQWFVQRLGRYLDLGPVHMTWDEREQVLKLMVEQGLAPLEQEGGPANG